MNGEPHSSENETRGDGRVAGGRIGRKPTIGRDVRLGVGEGPPPVIGDRATIRSGSIVYADVRVGDDFTTGHRTLVRAGSRIGDRVTVGTDARLDGAVEIGSDVSLQTGVFLPDGTELGDRVFVGPQAVFTNDQYPLRGAPDIDGPVIGDDVSIGANATLLPGVEIGARAFVAAGAVVTHDVPAGTLAVGTPARHEPLPDRLDRENELSDGGRLSAAPSQPSIEEGHEP